MLTPEVRLAIEGDVLCWLATCGADHRPSVSPKEVFTHFGDDSVIIANIASPGSARNIRDNPHACVSFIDIFRQKGFKVRGRAAVLGPSDAAYAAIEAPLLAITRGEFPFTSAFRVMADDVREIIAPRYHLEPGTTEADQIRSAMASYRVRPE